jgi:catechol 2,3-dioxygenase-like lactoylglutathione lyase family enzyme
MMMFTETAPVLRSFDDKQARAFYVGYLGFEVDWEHRFEPTLPLYMQVSRAGLVLHLSEHHGDASPGACVFVRMTGLAAFHAELLAKDYSALCPGIERKDWGLEMILTDPFMNRLRFCED